MLTKNIAVIADVGLQEKIATGGVLRSIRSLKEYSKYFNVYHVLPPKHQMIESEVLRYLHQELKIKKTISLRTPFQTLLGNPRLSFIYPLIPRALLKFFMRGLNELDVHLSAVIVLIEHIDYLYIGQIIKESFHIPSIALLQLPVMYVDKRRREIIEKAYELWYEELYANEGLNKIIREWRSKAEFSIAHSKPVREIVESYDALIAVSKSIVIEMGEAFSNKFYVLDPGVSLDQEDIELTSMVKRMKLKKEDYVVLGGRIDVLKGFIEGVYAFKKLVKDYPQLKLIATGHISEQLKWRIKNFLKRLELEDKVLLTGLLPRIERFKIVSKAKLMLYPSHVDAFPYAVLEALHLNTPVVGYDIPALRLHYGDYPSVKLVEEGDLEALASEAVDVMNIKEVEVNPPALPSWNEIIEREISIINRIVA